LLLYGIFLYIVGVKSLWSATMAEEPLNAMDYIRQVIMPETGMNMAQARGAIKKKGWKI